jgi:hypothetical protein
MLRMIADQPLEAVQGLTGVSCLAVMLTIPLHRALQRFSAGRTINIDSGVVVVTEFTLFSARTWRASLSEFCGVAHHLRATLSGLNHEIILVHAERGKCLCLHSNLQLSHSALARAAMILGLPERPAGTLYPNEIRSREAFAAS